MSEFCRIGMTGLVVAVLFGGCSTVPPVLTGEDAGRIAEDLCEFARESGPEGMSGVARIDGNRYFCVDDRGGMLHEIEIVLNEADADGVCTTKRGVRLEGRVDLEGCAYDPMDGRVWVSDEHDTSVRQFDSETGKETACVKLPEVYRKNVRPNRSLEGLTVSPDGHRMFVANEDTLTCDGPVAGGENGGVVRIQELVRTGKGAPWVPTRQFRYRTERIDGEGFEGKSISGVAGLCAPGDGTLLVLEREMSQKNPLFPSFHARLYEIDLDTDAIEPAKRLVWDENTMFANYEGICIGPSMKDGTKTLVLVSDGGGGADQNVLVLALRGGK